MQAGNSIVGYPIPTYYFPRVNCGQMGPSDPLFELGIELGMYISVS
jgi:hypothetical protein